MENNRWDASLFSVYNPVKKIENEMWTIVKNVKSAKKKKTRKIGKTQKCEKHKKLENRGKKNVKN